MLSRMEAEKKAKEILKWKKRGAILKKFLNLYKMGLPDLDECRVSTFSKIQGQYSCVSVIESFSAKVPIDVPLVIAEGIIPLRLIFWENKEDSWESSEPLYITRETLMEYFWKKGEEKIRLPIYRVSYPFPEEIWGRVIYMEIEEYKRPVIVWRHLILPPDEELMSEKYLKPSPHLQWREADNTKKYCRPYTS